LDFVGGDRSCHLDLQRRLSEPGARCDFRQLCTGQERSDEAFQAIESAIAGLPNAKRPLTRMRLRKSIATSSFRISSTAGRCSIKYDAKTPIVVWIGGEPVKWKLVEELVFYVSAMTNGEANSLTFRGTTASGLQRIVVLGSS
jgi:hypothetical protein